MDPAQSEQTAPLDGASSEWFAAEVHPHEPALKAYLRGHFPAIHDVDDLVHESYLRILKNRASEPVRSARGFLFTVARRLALDRVRSARRSPIKAVADLSSVSSTENSVSAISVVGEQEKIRLLAEAIDSLPDRCREVVVLRKLHQVPQKVVAARLGISEKCVENQLTRGIDRCRSFFKKRGLQALFDHEL